MVVNEIVTFPCLAAITRISKALKNPFSTLKVSVGYSSTL
jgi:hypothetical protein